MAAGVKIFISYFIFLAVKENSAPLECGVYVVKIIFLLIGQGSRPLLPIVWTN
jgi:hypothetical protein